MKTHAYLIIAHNEPSALEILLSVLDDERNHIYIHVDAKSKVIDKNHLKEICKKSAMTVIPSRNVYWSGYSQIQVELDLLLAATNDNHRYYHLISGVDLPLKTQDELHSFFDEHDGLEYVSGGKVNTWKVANRYKYYHYERLVTIFNRNFLRRFRYFFSAVQSILFIDRTKNLDIDFYFGGNWFGITHDFAKYLLEKRDFIKKTFEHGFFNDEIFLQTILYNSPFKNKVSPKMNLRYVDWKRGSPYIWQETDFEELTSKEIFFARKFSYEKHPEIMLRIRNHLLKND